MKKIAAILLSTGFILGLFSPVTIFALTPPLNWTPETCAINVEYSYNPHTQFACQCPTGSTYVNRGSIGTYPNNYTRFICQSTAPAIPNCQQAVPGMSYLTIASQCRCPNGTIVWSNNGYSDQCVWTTPTVEACKPMVPGVAYPMIASQCRCPNGTVVWSAGGYTDQCTWNTNVTCWDGSTAPNQNSCPAYKFCPGDSVTKRPLSYACPVQTKTCWNGSVVPVTQNCPTPVCHSEQYWNGYQCVNIYPRYPTNYCNDWTQWVWGTCMDTYYDYYDYYYDYYSNNWDSWYRW